MLNNIISTFRLLTFQSPSTSGYSNSVRDAVFAIGFYITLRLSLQFLEALPSPTFELWSVPYFITVIVAELGLLFTLVVIFARKAPPSQFITAFCLAASVSHLLHFGVVQLELIEFWRQWTEFAFGWIFVIVFSLRIRKFILNGNWRLSGAVFASLFAAGFLVNPFWEVRFVFLNSSWQYEQFDSDYARISAEDLYYAQDSLMKEQLAKLDQPHLLRPHLFTLVAGGTAHQGVFRREVEKIPVILDQQYGENITQLQLLNSTTTPYAYPLANKRNLATALREIAAAMNPETDVALIYLSSHGTSDRFSLSFWQAGTSDMTAQEFFQILEESGISNTVVIISACYSGSFIDDLQRSDRVIMTATDAESTSFGCSDESDWTWFGKALFQEGLTQSNGLLQAFDIATGRIQSWEKQDGVSASNPQISIGADIRPLLEALNLYKDFETAVKD